MIKEIIKLSLIIIVILTVVDADSEDRKKKCQLGHNLGSVLQKLFILLNLQKQLELPPQKKYLFVKRVLPKR